MADRTERLFYSNESGTAGTATLILLPSLKGLSPLGDGFMYASFKARTERFEGGSFIMMDATKYSVGYYPPPVEPGHVYEWPQKDHIEQAPAWCSVEIGRASCRERV